MKIQFRWYRFPDATLTAQQILNSIETDSKVKLDVAEKLVRETGMGKETWQEFSFMAPSLASAAPKIRKIVHVLNDYELSTPYEIFVGNVSLLSYVVDLERRIAKHTKKR